jgi:hypothetical protein
LNSYACRTIYNDLIRYICVVMAPLLVIGLKNGHEHVRPVRIIMIFIISVNQIMWIESVCVCVCVAVKRNRHEKYYSKECKTVMMLIFSFFFLCCVDLSNKSKVLLGLTV